MMRRRARQERSPTPVRLTGRDRPASPRDASQEPPSDCDEARWTHLMNAAFHLQQAEERDPAARVRAIRLSLQSALEAFETAEPLEDLPGFAVRRLLLAMDEALDAPPEADSEAAGEPRTSPAEIPPHLTPRR